MMETNSIGLYVHVPFCVKKCNYCDFCSYPNIDFNKRERYISSLIEEIYEYRKFGHISADTVFFGGGTPSLLTPDEFSRITVALRDVFDISDDAEFTIEANPGTLREEYLTEYVSCGVNRISIGLQSIHDNELKKLGRIHTYNDFLKSLDVAHRCGINNVNVDLMYGIPDQTRESFAKTLSAVASLDVQHISSYGLIVEDGTPFSECLSSLKLPDEDEECNMYFECIDTLRDKGFTHYEISNYAKDGFRCKHNLKYWRNREYIGLGVSGYSYFNGRKYGNQKNIDEYLSDYSVKYIHGEIIDRENEMFEYAMMNLRLNDGISLDDYKNRFGASFLDGRESLIDEMVRLGYMGISDGRVYITDRGFYVSNTIMSSII